MISKTTLLTAAAVMAQQVTGLSAHQHLHALEKRALAAEARVAELEARNVVVETVWEYYTTTVKWSPPAPTQNAVVVEQDVAPAPPPVPTTLAKVVAPAPAPAPAPASVAPAAPAPQQSQASNQASPSGTPAFSGKRGIAYNDPDMANTFGSQCKSCSWGYNWASTRGDFDSKYSYVPMLWGNSAEWTSNWEQNANQMISQGSKALFSFNEPDIASQANMSPSLAAQEFQTYMNGFSGKALIGAPAVSNSGQPNQGLDWLKQFVQACNGQCKFDFCNVHWYSEPQYADTLFSHLEQAHEICGGKPIWLTEFAPLGDGPAVNTFIQDVIPKLDQIDYLDAYSYFMVGQDKLMGSGGVTSAGQVYATA